jgi:phosphate transport system ATP-binding protein
VTADERPTADATTASVTPEGELMSQVASPPDAPAIRVRMDSQALPAAAPDAASEPAQEPVIRFDDLHFYYGSFRAVKGISIDVLPQRITALIGPSGCGKSTVLRTINRMNDLIPGTRVEGKILYHGENLYGKGVDPVEVRRRIGMVFQKPNPFPKSIYDNIAFGPRINGFRGNMDDLVEQSLRRAVLWDEVKDKLKQSGLALSGGQQQRLCIARAIATSPDVILMDEPCSALDPRSTLQIEELMAELRTQYTIVIVTHNMQQAARASDHTVFMNMAEDRAGYVVEQGPTIGIFTNPTNQMTEDYVSGRFG